MHAYIFMKIHNMDVAMHSDTDKALGHCSNGSLQVAVLISTWEVENLLDSTSFTL